MERMITRNFKLLACFVSCILSGCVPTIFAGNDPDPKYVVAAVAATESMREHAAPVKNEVDNGDVGDECFGVVNDDGSDLTYEEARQVHLDTGAPLFVFVTAKWCGPCQQMKQHSLPRADLGSELFVMVDIDEQPELAKKLINGGPVPQFLSFVKNQRFALVGAQSAEQLDKAIENANKLLTDR
jgi:thiol-disulfide isomerase/thioredoxin